MPHIAIGCAVIGPAGDQQFGASGLARLIVGSRTVDECGVEFLGRLVGVGRCVVPMRAVIGVGWIAVAVDPLPGRAHGIDVLVSFELFGADGVATTAATAAAATGLVAAAATAGLITRRNVGSGWVLGRRDVRGRVTGGSRVLGRGLFARSEQRVAARATRAGHALVVDQDRGSRGDDRGVAVGLIVLEPEHRDVEVLQRVDGCEAAQIVGEIFERDALDSGPGATAVFVVREEADHRFHVADVGARATVGATGVKAGSRPVDVALRERRQIDVVLRQLERGSERIGAHDTRGLEQLARASARLLAVLVSAAARGSEQQHSGHHRGRPNASHGSPRSPSRRRFPDVFRCADCTNHLNSLRKKSVK